MLHEVAVLGKKLSELDALLTLRNTSRMTVIQLYGRSKVGLGSKGLS